MSEFRMPSLGADMDDGELIEWKVGPGDAVKRGDIVAVVETRKGAIDIEIFEDGVIEELLVEEGSTVPVGAVLARLAPAGAEPGDFRAAVSPTVSLNDPMTSGDEPVATEELMAMPELGDALAAAVRGEELRRGFEAAEQAAKPQAPPRKKVSPLARRMAEELGVDASTLEGTGPDGAVSARDVERAAGRPPGDTPARHSLDNLPTVRPAPEREGPPREVSDMRSAIGAAMARSKREIPHYYLRHEIDLSAALEWMTDWNAERPVTERLLPAVLLLKAVGRAAADFPAMNGVYRDGAFSAADSVNLGVAIHVRNKGLIAPCLMDVPGTGIAELMAAFKDLVERARRGGLRGSEMGLGTLTVTSLGERGVDEVHGVIYPPQTALVGFGLIRERPVAVDGGLFVRPTAIATLAADHRVSDGHEGALFLRRIDNYLNEPESLK